MKLSNKYTKMEEIPITQGTTSTDFTKVSKPLFLQTISSNFSSQSKQKKIISRNHDKLNQNNTEEKIFSPLKTFDNIHSSTEKRKTNKYNYTITNDSGLKTQRTSRNNNKLKTGLFQNIILPRNINSYTHLIRGKNVGNYAEIDWVLRLRDYEQKKNDSDAIDYKNYYYRKKNDLEKNDEIKHENIKLTEHFSPPHFYDEDLQKYKTKKKKLEKSLILKLNPNFYKIRHLIYRNKGDQSNYSQFHFATTLRNIKSYREEKNKKFQVLPIFEKNNNNNYKISKFLAPLTEYSKINLKKIEKYLSKNHDYKYEEARVDGQKIMKKIYTENNKYTISGKGETLGDLKYNNDFYYNNIFANKKILETEANPMCKFELSLRTYDNNIDKGNKTHRNFRPKRKIK